jgi:hypothetical protein
MNPIIETASDHLAKGDQILSIFVDATSAGILVRNERGAEKIHEIDGDPSQYAKWAQEAANWLEQRNWL